MTSPLSRMDFFHILSRIGSRSFLQPASLMILVFPSMVLLSTFGSEATTIRGYWIWFEANLISIGLTSILIAGIRYFWGRFFPDFVFPLWSVVLVSAILGFLKSWLTASWVIQFPEVAGRQNAMLTIVVSGTIAAIPTLMICSLIVLLLEQFKRERELLLTARSIDQIRERSEEDKEKLAGLSGVIKDLINNLKKRNEYSNLEIKNLLKNLVDSQVRPLASSLFTEFGKHNQSFSPRELLLTAMKQTPSAIAPAVALVVLIPRSTVWAGPVIGPIAVIVFALLIYASIRLANLIAVKLGLSGPIVFFTNSVLVPLVLSLIATNVFDFFEQTSWTIPIVVIVWFGQLAALVGMARVAITSAANNRNEVEKLLGSNPITELSILRRQRRQLANQLHGEVQSRLMTIALKNTGPSDLGNEVAIQELTQIAELIDRGPKESLGLVESIQRLQRLWSGFIELELEISEDFDADNQPSVICSIIEEGVSNAFKHGLASKVKIQLLDERHIAITDNGIGPTKGSPGLGSKLIENASKEWSLSPGENGGSQLKIHLLPNN